MTYKKTRLMHKHEVTTAQPASDVMTNDSRFNTKQWQGMLHFSKIPNPNLLATQSLRGTGRYFTINKSDGHKNNR